MSTHALRVRADWLRMGAKLFPCVFLCAAIGSTSFAQENAKIIRVDEQWELVIQTPDPDSDAPQVTSVISPGPNIDALYAAFEINHRSVPVFMPGGLQLQVWDNDQPVSSHQFTSEAVSTTPGEVVRWTQSMTLAEGNLTFAVTGGASTTWGTFGAGGTLRCVMPTALEDLNGYNPEVSVQNSGVGYAANRVGSLVLRKVTAYTADDQVIEDNTARIVHQNN